MTFPRLLYQVWFQGTNDPSFSAIVRENTEAWKRMNPTWRHHVVDQHRLRQACRSISPETEACFLRLAHIHIILAIDFGRYCLLYQTGGMYVDTDMWCIRPVDACTALQQQITQDKPFVAVCQANPSLSHVVNNGMMVSTPGHPFLRHFILDIQKKVTDHRADKEIRLKEWFIIHCAGPLNLSKQLRIFQKNDQHANTVILYFPFDVFEASVDRQLFRVTDQTIALHVREGSWISSDGIKGLAADMIINMVSIPTILMTCPVLSLVLLLVGILIGVLLVRTFRHRVKR